MVRVCGMSGTLGLQALPQSDGNPDDSLAIYGAIAAHLVQVFLADGFSSEQAHPSAVSSSTSRCNTSGAGLTPLSGER